MTFRVGEICEECGIVYPHTLGGCPVCPDSLISEEYRFVRVPICGLEADPQGGRCIGMGVDHCASCGNTNLKLYDGAQDPGMRGYCRGCVEAELLGDSKEIWGIQEDA